MYSLTITLAKVKQLYEDEMLYEYIMAQLEKYESLGPLPGILLPMIESFLPILPLVAFVLANAVAYGLLKGFFYSWIGSSVGAIIVFTIIRRLGKKRFMQFISERKQVKRVTSWVEEHGFGPLFLLMCFPFSPSSIINVVAGLSGVSRQQFVLAVLLGKSVMIFTIAYVGASIRSFAEHPVKAIVVAVCIALFWILGKFLEKYLQRKAERNRVRED
ncbi:TVP38/TMEM64 family protein [Thalassobacillus pellis]|uniref:TVP38/TMEM64 family protein n=1 Tax=Thalassobacillus pellis TaxID=748008 RepID=UPI001960FFB2|nr:TVP38/TMEM64 family protein [Thalassobacillus pellis]MBM7554101.1 putative membrane protein YdjX (TVP38/TMEM64 family) [Thalassobacillus pellis]